MEQSKKTSFDFYMLPLVLAVAVVPLLTMMTAYSSGIGKYTWASGGSFVDFFQTNMLYNLLKRPCNFVVFL